MELKLYNFSKRSNSTKVPAESSAFTTNVTLKENTSLYSPSFLLAGNPTNYNYCKWNGKYYYINDYIYEGRNTYTITCTMDVLATYKSSILASSAFVLYSSSNYDVTVPDTRLSMKAEPTYRKNTKDLYYQGDTTNHTLRGNGYFSVSYIGQPPTATEPSTVLGFDFNNFRTIARDINSRGISEFFATGYMNKLLNNASQAITDVKFIPVSLTAQALEQNTHQIILGADCALPSYGYVLGRHEYSTTINIPWQFDDFRNRSQYTELLLGLPGVGVVTLNPDNYIGYNSITVRAMIDEKSGDITYDISGLERFQCNISKNIHISTGSNPGLLSLVNGVAGVAAGVATGHYASAAATGFNAVFSTFSHNGGSVGGATGNTGYSIQNQVTLESCSHNTTIEPSAMAVTYGRPCNKVLSLANLTGYVQTRDARVSVNASDEVNDSINNMLDGGIYIE